LNVGEGGKGKTTKEKEMGVREGDTKRKEKESLGNFIYAYYFIYNYSPTLCIKC
jgi:hypothetical protein